MVPTLVQSKDAHVLRSEVMALLAKGAIETIPPAQSESGFYRLLRAAFSPYCSSLRGVDARPTDGSENLGDLWQGRGRPLRLKRQLSLPNLLFKERGCVPNRSDPSGNQTNQGSQTQSPPSGPTLEEPALVLGAVSAANSSPVAHSPEAGPHLSGEQDDLAPPTRVVGSALLGSQRESIDLPESVLRSMWQL